MNGRHAVPCGALTLLEASGNSRVTVERLAAIGFEAKVLNADVLRGISERDRVNDRTDAEKLVSYFGLNPAVDSSGEQERRQRMHGREHGHLSRFGRSDMKHLCAEIGQTLLRRNDCPAAKWAKRKLAEGKNYNKVCMAVARKTITYAWYVLKGIPSPGREMQPFYPPAVCATQGANRVSNCKFHTKFLSVV